MLYQVGQGAKYHTLDGLPAGKGDVVQLVSDVICAKTFNIQSAMKFDGQGHAIVVANPKAHAINFAKWCQAGTAINFKGNTQGGMAAANVSGRACTVEEWTQTGKGRLLNFNDSIDCTFKHGTHISKNCTDYSIYGGDGDLSGSGPSNATFYNMTIEVWAQFKTITDKGVKKTVQVDEGQPGGVMHAWRVHKSVKMTTLDCSIKAHGIRSAFTFKEWSGFHHKRLAVVADGGAGGGFGALSTDKDPGDFCDDILLEDCDITLDNFLALQAGVRGFKMHGGTLRTKQSAINFAGAVGDRKPPDDVEVIGTHIFAPAACKGPGTNLKFDCQITLPNGSLHKVGLKGDVL